METAAEACGVRDDYLQLYDLIAGRGLDCNISLKLTHLGLGLAGGPARENLLELADKGEENCDKVRRIALDQLDQIAHKIADLQSMQRVLSDMAARCTGATVPDCPILDALFAGVISPAPSRPSRYRPRP